MEFLEKNWEKIIDSYIFFDLGKIHRAIIHHYRKDISISVRVTNAGDQDSVFIALEQELDIKRINYNSYKYRKSLLEFEIGNWRPDLFSESIIRIGNIIGGNPYLDQAFIKSLEGDVEKLVAFHDIESFRKEVGRRASLFGEVFVRMDARGIAIGIGVSSDHKRLTIKSSLDSKSIDIIIDAFSEKLKLKSVKASNRDSGNGNGASTSPPPDNSWLKYGIPFLVSLVTAASTTGSVGLGKAIWPDYKITIESPIGNIGKMASQTGELILSWHVQPIQTSFRKKKTNIPLDIVIISKTGTKSYPDTKSPFKIKLEPGIYNISLGNQDIPSELIQVEVTQVIENTSR